MGKWTQSELAILFASEGGTQPELPGRSPESVRQKILRIGIKNKAKVPTWTKREISLLKKSVASGCIFPEIEGRTKGAIRNKMTELGLREKSPPKSEWSEVEISIIKSFSGSGTPQIEGRTAESIRRKMRSMRMPVANRNWSEEQISELRAKVATTKKVEIEGRSSAAIVKKIHDLGLMTEYLANRGRGRSNLKWSAEEIEMVKMGSRKIKGRSKCSIMDMRRRLGIKKTIKPRPYWTSEREAELERLHLQGMSARRINEIGVFKERSRMAIQKKLCRMGLAKRMGFKRLPDKAKDEFLAFLSHNFTELTPRQIADRWNCENPKLCVNKRRVIKGLKEIGIDIRSFTRDRAKKFILSAWNSHDGLRLQDKLTAISASWNEANPANRISTKRVRIIAKNLSLIRKKMPELFKMKLKKFLSEKWEGKTPDELAKVWNDSCEYKMKGSQIARLLGEMGIKVSCSEVKKMNTLRKREKQIFAEGAANSKALEERIRAERVRIMRSRFEQNKSIFNGMVLGEEVLSETLQ